MHEATRRLHGAAARALGAGRLSDEDVQEVRRLLKAGRYSRGRPAGHNEWLVGRYLRRAEELEARVGALPKAVPCDEARTPGRGTPPGRRATPARKRTRPPARPDRKPLLEWTLAELTPERRDWLVARIRLMRRLDRGESLAGSLQATGLKFTPRQVSTLRQRWRREGVPGLYNRRWLNGRPLLYPDKVVRLCEAYAMEFPAASARRIHKKLMARCSEMHIAAPSASWVADRLQKLDPNLKAIRSGGWKKWERQMAPRASHNPAEFANHIWFVDHTPLDIEVRVQLRSGEWIRIRPWLTLVIDVYSRAIMGFQLSEKHPDGWTSALAFRHAALPKKDPRWKMQGRPCYWVPDCGPDFTSEAAQSSIEGLAEFYTSQSGNPNDHAFVERPFLTFNRSHLAGLYGYIRAGRRDDPTSRRETRRLHTLPELRAEIEKWIIEDYLVTKHESLNRGPVDRAPGEVWEQTVRLRAADPRELDVLLLHSDKVRTIGKQGVRMTFKERGREIYMSPAIADMVGRKVTVRYNRDDTDVILLYDARTPEFIAEVPAQGTSGYSGPAIVEARGDVRDGIRSRLDDYHDMVGASDRPGTAVHEAEQRKRAGHRPPKSKTVTASPAAPSKPALTLTPQSRELAKRMRGRGVA